MTQSLEEEVDSDDSPKKTAEEPVKKETKASAQGKRGKDPNKKEIKQEGKK